MHVGWSLVAHLRTGLVSGPAHFESADSNVVWAYTLCAKLWPNSNYIQYLVVSARFMDKYSNNIKPTDYYVIKQINEQRHLMKI